MTDRALAFSGKAYLTLAFRAISEAGRPLSPMDMLDIARTKGFMPPHLYGATMHRTLNARLSEHIRYQNDSSEFFRTGPSQFYLHSLAVQPETPDQYKKVYAGHLRSKEIRKENVLVAPRQALREAVYGEFTPYDESVFERLYGDMCRFVDRKAAESDDTIKQFVTFTLVHYASLLLIYRRGKFTSTSDRLKGQLSVGFGGHVNDRDFGLFSRGGEAFRSNAARELREELFLDEFYHGQEETLNRSRILGYVNVDGTPDAEHHVAVLVAFEHKSAELPKKGELSINQLSWMDLNKPRNDLTDFDHWSEIILRNIYQGRIRV